MKSTKDEGAEFLGLRTQVYQVNDLTKAKDWYRKVLGVTPYFDQPFYVGFNVAGYELGLGPAEGKVGPGGGAVTYWGVADAAASLRRLLDLGAKKRDDVTDVGEGIKVAAVEDPFGNVFGIIENPHFKL